MNWREDEIKELLDHAKAEDDTGQGRDTTCYELLVNAGAFSINLEKIPKKFIKVFEDLKNNLKIEKK